MPHSNTLSSPRATVASIASPPPSPPLGVSVIDFLTERARPEAEAKAREYTRQLLQDQAELDIRVDRCVAMTEELLIETRAFLGQQPPKLPERLLRPVEHAEMQHSAGLKLAKFTAEAALVDADRAYESAEALLRSREARELPRMLSQRGDTTSSPSSSHSRSVLSSESSGASSKELESAGTPSADDATHDRSEAASGPVRGWQSIASMKVEMRWTCALQ
ncbi:hypothetical protein LTR36_010898 [Oleoguttula mirabilis]|uniref:Uncharacterized protein n=1 Tax=Oleoguttula mirabilis TaxID=1507867 RepID=A0AAV9J3Y2_9PEZI|nr:hypothetical protein LTR36_010898 [Oleoguttula mirabilis]